jgi:hypothetical protein
MAIEIAKYQFHSWARKGISSNIIEPDTLGTGASAQIERAQIPVTVKANASDVTKKFTLIGPGDIIGMNRSMVIRTEPLNWITNFEPNYLAFAEFYDEDFPWRYTPAAAAGEKLRPWFFLFVLKEDEFERTGRQYPLPSITVLNKDALPPHDETWLWAHVHSNAGIPAAELSDFEEFLLSLNKTVNNDPDQVFSRVMSPRKLEDEKAYYAFLVPAFETGRLAGLDLPTAGINAQAPSWDANGAKGEMPVYYEWFFRTGKNADFESLVKLLEPRAMDKRVGIRDMDCSRPLFVKADGSGELPSTEPPIIGLEGALKSPYTVSTKFPDPPEEKEFLEELEKVVNLPETNAADLTKDPIISVPFYGQNHARQKPTEQILLDIDSNKWLNDLNRDPRTRVSAGFGTLVIQKNQESYMQRAWQQVTKIIEANKKITVAIFSMFVSHKYTAATFSKLDESGLLAMTSSVHKKVMGSPTTIYHQLTESRLPAAVFNGAFRRLVRPNGPLAKKMPKNRKINYKDIVTGLNSGKITASPPRPLPAGLPNIKDVTGKISKPVPPFIKWLIKNKWLLFLLAFIFLILALITGLGILFIALAVLAIAAYFPLKNIQQKAEDAEILINNEKQLEAIQHIPPRPAFTLKLDSEKNTVPATQTSPGADSVEAKNFRLALTDMHKRLSVHPVVKPVTAFNMQNGAAKIKKAIDPYRAYPLKLSYAIFMPGFSYTEEPEKITPAMAYPDFEEPMYKKLVDISSELLLPNLKLIPENTISLLETNQKFIESYMVGLNHEMGSELLWREYPTDRRGSYFRQFWDVSGITAPDSGKTPAQLAEEYKDIKPIHTWQKNTLLGSHNNRDAEGDLKQLVLVIRGELLKHYPNTVIFAQKAMPAADPNDPPVINLDMNDVDFRKQVLFPLYKAEILPDIKFFGFDLTIEEARGSVPSKGFTDSLGWFFVIQEVPGEPRFGMDITYNAGSDGITWDDLAWDKFGENPPPFIKSSARPLAFNPTDNSPDKWGVNSANMAYVLFQKPNMVAVHAKEMLESL